uniref:Sec-independent protein translocase protein tatC, putative n=1 Tax=Arundo donax TaxID=35708 RepID=A0A0A9K535_ARUDO
MVPLEASHRKKNRVLCIIFFIQAKNYFLMIRR